MTKPNKTHGLTDEQRTKMCEGKVRYSDELTAVAGAMHDMSHPECTAKKMYKYKCPNCHGWHLTRKAWRNGDPIERA